MPRFAGCYGITILMKKSSTRWVNVPMDLTARKLWPSDYVALASASDIIDGSQRFTVQMLKHVIISTERFTASGNP